MVSTLDSSPIKQIIDVLEACPCLRGGEFLWKPYPPPEPFVLVDVTPTNPWAPFDDRIAFEWAHEHYVKVKASKKQIGCGLDLWKATMIDCAGKKSIPWQCEEEMCANIDQIQEGSVSWTTHILWYNGPKPDSEPVPTWMDQDFELNTRDVLKVLEQQIANPELNGKFDYVPFREFDNEGDRVWSNLMLAHWAWTEAVRHCLHCLLQHGINES